MRKPLLRGLCAAPTFCGLLAATPALAAGSGMPWEAPLQQVVDSITGPVVQIVAVIAVILFGVGVAFSSGGSDIRRGMGILLGLSIAFAASTFFLDFLGFGGGLEIG